MAYELSENALVTLDQAKAYLRIDGSENDEIIAMMIDAATRKTEDHCSSFWVKREITETHIGDGKQNLNLRRMPIVEVDSVTLDGDELTDYVERLSMGRLYRSVWSRGAEIVVTYTAGYGEAMEYGYEGELQQLVPDAVLAVLAAVGEWYNRRFGATSESVSGIGSVTYGDEDELPASAKAKLTALRQRVI